MEWLRRGGGTRLPGSAGLAGADGQQTGQQTGHGDYPDSCTGVSCFSDVSIGLYEVSPSKGIDKRINLGLY